MCAREKAGEMERGNMCARESERVRERKREREEREMGRGGEVDKHGKSENRCEKRNLGKY